MLNKFALTKQLINNLFLIKMKRTFLTYFLLTFVSYSYCQNAFEFPFCSIDTSFGGQQLVIPSSVTLDILATEDSLAYLASSDKFARFKAGFSGILFVPDSDFDDTKGTLYVSQSLNAKNQDLGDGGGVLQIKVKKDAGGKWIPVTQTVNGKQVYYRMADFSPVGGAAFQHSMIYRTTGRRIWVTEDCLLNSNSDLSAGHTDLNDYTVPDNNGIASGQNLARYQNMGWITEIDPTASQMKATKKWYGLGRGGYRDILEINANSFLMITGQKPSVLILALRQGGSASSNFTMSCYQQNADGIGGTWVELNEKDIDGNPLPLTFEDLLHVHQRALDAGATMFNNLSHMVRSKGSHGNSPIYITETGGETGSLFADHARATDARLAHHLMLLDKEDGLEDNKLTDHYGRILEMNYTTLNIKPTIEGGPAADCRFHFSNPDGIGILTNTWFDQAAFTDKSKEFLFVHENIPATSEFRNPSRIGDAYENRINETYVFDLTNEPSRDNLHLFSIGPKGSEITGFSAVNVVAYNENWESYGGNTVFVTLQYPNPANEEPYNKSMIVALTGFYDYFEKPTACQKLENECQDPPIGVGLFGKNEKTSHAGDFYCWPNPASQYIQLNKISDISLYDFSGKLILSRENADRIDVRTLLRGLYFVQNTEGQTVKLIIE